MADLSAATANASRAAHERQHARGPVSLAERCIGRELLVPPLREAKPLDATLATVICSCRLCIVDVIECELDRVALETFG